jgi:protease-4
MSHHSLGREVLSVGLRSLTILLTIVLVLTFVGFIYDTTDAISDGSCNVAVLPLEGVIVPFHGIGDYPLTVTPQLVREFFDRAEADPFIEAILVEINSPGGTPVAAEHIAERLRESELPVLTLIGDIGASGGYLVAAAGDQIVASTMSDVGGIGVTMSYLEESEKNDEEGITFVQLARGEFKDAGNPNKPLTDAERERFEADLDLVYQEFITQVATYRGLERERVAALADGATMPGIRAIEEGLVDHLGGRTRARELIAENLAIPIEDVTLCEYENEFIWF